MKQFIAEHGIERSALPLATNGTQERSPNRNPDFPQFPRLPLFKEILQILAKLRKKQQFLLELGRGFAFIGRQYIIPIGSRQFKVDDNPLVGIVLGARKDELLMEYALQGIDNQLFAARYQLY